MLSSDKNKVQYALADPFPTEFSITFKYWAKSEITAVLSFDDGSPDQELVQDTDYSLTDPGDTGTLTRITAWTDAVRLTIYRTVSLTQGTDLRNGEAIDADVLESDIDRAAARDQQLEETMERAITVPITDPEGSFQLPTKSAEATERILLRGVPGARPGTPTRAIAEAVAAVQRYFKGERTDFSDIKLDLTDQDALSKQIYVSARQVEWGHTTTYGALAKEIGAGPESARDVGQAMTRNPVPLIIPCDRVLAPSRRELPPGGFSFPAGPPRRRAARRRRCRAGRAARGAGLAGRPGRGRPRRPRRPTPPWTAGGRW